MRLSSLGYGIAFAIIGGVITGAIAFQSFQERPGLAPAAPTGPLASGTVAPSPLSSSLLPLGRPPQEWSTLPSGLSLLLWSIETREGTLKIRFFPKKAPRSVARITELAASGFYDGLKFHRVIEDFVIQAGDPSGVGSGGSGKKLSAELTDLPHVTGTVGLARGADPDSADSQFYITLTPQPHLDGQYTVIGQLVEGLEAALKIHEGSVIVRTRFEEIEPSPEETLPGAQAPVQPLAAPTPSPDPTATAANSF